MLSKKAKVDRQLAQKILATGRNFYGVFTTLRIIKVSDKKSRFSFVVSKKVASPATVRNRLKRRGLSAVAHYYKEIHPPVGTLFFMKKSAVSVSYSDLKRDIHELLLKSGLISRSR